MDSISTKINALELTLSTIKDLNAITLINENVASDRLKDSIIKIAKGFEDHINGNQYKKRLNILKIYKNYINFLKN